MIKKRRFRSYLSRLFFFLLIFFYVDYIFAQSVCQKYEDVGGAGVYPYNFRLIDGCLAAGGSLFNPVSKSNSDEKVCKYINNLKKLGIKSLMLLHVPLKDPFTPRLEALCEREGVELIKMRMNAQEIPSEEQTRLLMSAIASGSYVHCMWGCDRTGAIIGKYLRTKGYTGQQAFEAIVNKGSHAGRLGGFKRKPGNKNLLLYFWPEVVLEAPNIYSEFAK